MDDIQSASLNVAVEIIREIDFPTLPLYLQLIQKEIAKSEPSFELLGNYISQDIALTAKLLKVVNSPAYCLRYPIENIPQALTTLGTKNFYTAVLEDALEKQLNQHHLSSQNFSVIWKHATDIARSAQCIANKLNEINETPLLIDLNYAYLAGLFHDCGIPIMAARFPLYEQIVESAFTHGELLVETEEKHFLTDHSVVCYIVAKMWELPQPVQKAIYCHHSLDLNYYEDEQERYLSLVLRIAESFYTDIYKLKDRVDHPFVQGTISVDEALSLLETELGIDQELAEEVYCHLENEMATEG